jgi:hypothetical protein
MTLKNRTYNQIPKKEPKMKKLFKITLSVIVTLAVIIIVAVLYVKIRFPQVNEASDIKIIGTEEQIKRGEYLANNVLNCIDCHSKRDFSLFAGPIVPGTEGQGGEIFGEDIGLPGTIYSKNITPFALHEWTDGELYRLITVGVRKNGEPIFPFMPYEGFSKMAPEDINSVIAYVRTLKTIDRHVPESKINFPVNVIMRTLPHDVVPPGKPDTTDLIKYGQYIVDIAACRDCHTPIDKGQFDMDRYLSGGNEFAMPNQGTVRSANITSDKTTGIGTWTKELFVNRFKNPEMPHNKRVKIGRGEFQTIMPWANYAKMEDKDLEAIYAYLMTAKPIANSVVRFTPEGSN